jgi:holo-[acyl-carrier protein] synthase
VGIDVVSIPDFAEQVDQPGTVFAETFTPGERRDAADKSSVAARPHRPVGRQGGRDQGLVGFPVRAAPVLPEGIHRDIEVITDMWGRPRSG